MLTTFSIFKKKCCDPMHRHPGKYRSKSLCVISFNMFEKVGVPGVKLYCDCLIHLQKQKHQRKDNETDEMFAMDVDNNYS